MEKILFAALFTIITTGAALAADTIILPASNGDVAFKHKVHEERMPDCKPCHADGKGGKIEGFNRELAHKICVGCHYKGRVSPIACSGCHKK